MHIYPTGPNHFYNMSYCLKQAILPTICWVHRLYQVIKQNVQRIRCLLWKYELSTVYNLYIKPYLIWTILAVLTMAGFRELLLINIKARHF